MTLRWTRTDSKPHKEILNNSNIRLPSTPARKTSEFFDSISNLDPMKFNPPNEEEAPVGPLQECVPTLHTFYSLLKTKSRMSYSSFTQLNPFDDENRYTKMGDFTDYDGEKTPKALPKLPAKAYKPPAMIQSRSEGNIASRSGHSSTSSGSQFSHLHYSSDEDRIRRSEDTLASSTPSRGRSTRRAASPSKNLEDIQEVQTPFTKAPASPKRSRSPMKRMFGERGWLGKSMSMNELPSEEYRKTGLKHWGVKIKKGVGSLVSCVLLVGNTN